MSTNLGLTETSTINAGSAYTVRYDYDSYSRVKDITYPSTSFKVRQHYDAYGYLYQVNRVLSGGGESLLWQTTVSDAHARVVQEMFGNGLYGNRSYDHETGDLQTIQTGTGANPTGVQNLSYTFDAIDNLLTRADAIQGLNETFTYDTVNRLTRSTAQSGAVNLTKTYSYNAAGNITSKSDVGTYTYGSTRPHAVTQIQGVVNTSYTYDANGNQLSGGGRTITYTAFNKPKTVTGANGTTTFYYDVNDNRFQKSTATKDITYVGKLYERVTTSSLTEHKHYIYGGSALVATYTERNNGTPAETRYVHTDHLGSINVLTDDNGNVVQRLSFDPHGKRRNPDGSDATGPIASSINRGYTRHEHDDEVGLINMNARLYDPVIGRFITPDTIVQAAGDSQAYNRYSYVRNNPLSLVDPSGHSWLSKGWRRLKRNVKRVTTKIVEKVGGIKYVGGLMNVGLLAGTHFGYAYGWSTGDWKTVGRAHATGAVIAATYWAGGLAAAQYQGTFLSGLGFVGSSAAIGYTSGYSIARIYGASGADARQAGIAGARAAAVMATLRMGWEGMKEAVNEGARASGNTSQCVAGECTAGSRTSTYGYNADGSPKEIPSLTGYANQGMGPETMAGIGRPDLRAPHMWDSLPGAPEFFEVTSKVHDFGNMFRYNAEGLFVPFESGWANDLFNLYSMSTMAPAAAYTAYAFGGLYFELNDSIRSR